MVPLGKFLNQSKATPLRVPMNSLAMIIFYITSLRSKVIDMMVGELLPSYVCNIGGLSFMGMTLNPIPAGKDESSLLSSVHPSRLGMRSELGCL